jgi:hypothetical protein
MPLNILTDNWLNCLTIYHEIKKAFATVSVHQCINASTYQRIALPNSPLHLTNSHSSHTIADYIGGAAAHIQYRVYAQ